MNPSITVDGGGAFSVSETDGGIVTIAVQGTQVVQEADGSLTIQEQPLSAVVLANESVLVTSAVLVQVAEVGIAGPQGIQGVPGSSSFYQEIPAGVVDGNNRTFTLSQVPGLASSLLLLLNGLAQTLGGGRDYTLSGQTITMMQAPSGADTLLAYYNR